MKAQKTKSPVAPPPAQSITTYLDLPLHKLLPSPTNPRKTFPEAALQQLADSIASLGVKQPLLVRPLPCYRIEPPDMLSTEWRLFMNGNVFVAAYLDERPAREEMKKLVAAIGITNGEEYEIVCGERRFRASGLAGRATAPCMVEILDDLTVRKIQLVENLQREDLNPIEEAQGYKDLMDQHQWTVDNIKQHLNKSRSHVFAKLSLLKTAPAVRKAMVEDKISASVGELVGRLPGEKLQGEALNSIISQGQDYRGYEPMSYRAVSKMLQDDYTVDLSKAAFDLKKTYEDAPHPGPCTDCPMRSGNARDEYPDIKSVHICLNPACYKKKTELHGQTEIERVRKAGGTILEGEKAADLFDVDGDLKYNSNYVKADSTCYQSDRNKSYGALLKKTSPPLTALSPTGDVVELYRKADLPGLLKEVGIKTHHSVGSSHSAEDKKKQALVKLRVELAKQVTPGILNHAIVDVGGRIGAGFLHLLVQAAYHHTSIDAHTFVAKRRGLAKTQNESRSALEKYIKGLDDDREECMKLTLELLVCARHGVCSYGPIWNDSFKKACGLAGVDLPKLEKQLSTEKKQGNAKASPTAELALDDEKRAKPPKPSKPTKPVKLGHTILHRNPRKKGKKV